MRILNAEALTGHGNVRGRRAVVEILDAGLQAADAYAAVHKLVRVERAAGGGERLIVGHAPFEPQGTPVTGDEVYDLSGPGRVFIFGAGKGVIRVAQALEEILGDRLAGGHIVDKKGAAPEHLDALKRVEVTLGAHPVPDEACVRGCRRMREWMRGLRAEDLVFTVGASGFSSLLTLPAPGLSLEDVRRTVYMMQIERGVPTGDLSPVRNHLDLMKGGRIAAYIHPARAIHLLAKDPETYERWIYENYWVHTLPDRSTYGDAVKAMQKWDAWEDAPQAVCEHLLRADPEYETVKPERYLQFRHRVYGLLPGEQGVWPSAKVRAEELGYCAVNLAMGLSAEARYAGQTVATIAKTIERTGGPLEPPVALLTAGEMLVTVGQETGIGGRNQEYALAAALQISGSDRIVVGAVDTDGTDGPGAQYMAGAEQVPTLAGGLVDGTTLREAQARGIDLRQALRRHNATPALLALESGVLATQSTGLQDLGVILVMNGD
jgi:glycerate-2-kinase